MKKISIVSPCYNEEGNIEELRSRVAKALAQLPDFDHEHIFIDNASEDGTLAKLKAMAAKDPRIKVIVNNRNFGLIRSAFHALHQAQGDLVIHLVSDLQDPPEYIPEMVRLWQDGFQVIYCVKEKSEEGAPMFAVRKLYYWLLGRLSEVEMVNGFNGFGLYDKEVIEQLRRMNDPHPFFRGLISELGFRSTTMKYHQPTRKKGITSNSFYRLYDNGMLGLTTYSKVPIRVATLSGFALSLLSFAMAVGYLVAKLLFWDKFSIGMAPLLIGMFFFSSVQLFFIGVIGEYIGSIHTRVLHRPLVIERERINF